MPVNGPITQIREGDPFDEVALGKHEDHGDERQNHGRGPLQERAPVETGVGGHGPFLLFLNK